MSVMSTGNKRFFLNGGSRSVRQLPKPKPYPLRPIDQSVSHCVECGREHRRSWRVTGPQSLHYWVKLCGGNLKVKQPTKSNWIIWKLIPPIAWLVSTPSYKDQDYGWYLIAVYARCEHCGSNFPQKEEYVRKLSRLQRMIQWIRSVVTHTVDRTIIP